MKRFFFILLFFTLLSHSAKSQIVGESIASKWEKVFSVRQGFVKLMCHIEKADEGERKVYHITTTTSNRFDEFCLTLGEIDDAIATCEYLYNFSENEERGVNKTFDLLDKRRLTVETYTLMGRKALRLGLSDCAGIATIGSPELLKIINKLKEIRESELGENNS